jgi:L-cysteine S-thiosulfotransferase
MNIKQLTTSVAVMAFAGLTATTAWANYDNSAADVIKKSVQDRGIAKVDRLNVDEANRLCSAADVARKPIAKKAAAKIEADNMKTIKWPAEGKFLGDWKEGEKIAQSGRGLTWSDAAGTPNGGNCYNCHQISKEEISYGTLGPSLYNYGKLRGVTDPSAAASKAIVEYTWGKLYNSRAYSACSQMPRAGHMGILTEAQLQHVMALLLDPASPVNK